MSELYTKSMKKLELDAVLQRLSEQAVSQEAKARCLAYQDVYKRHTQGRGQYAMEPSHYTELPRSMQEDLMEKRGAH